jgi:hypothetical protein
VICSLRRQPMVAHEFGARSGAGHRGLVDDTWPDLRFGYGLKHRAMSSFQAGGGMGRPLQFNIGFDLIQQVLRSGGYAWSLMRRRQVMPDPGGSYGRCLSRRHQVIFVAYRSKVVRQWLETWRYGMSSTSSFSSSGIRLAKSFQHKF